MIEERRAPPYAALLVVVVVLLMVAPNLIGDQGEVILESIAELLSPAGLLFVPIALLLIIQFLSSARGSAVSAILSAGEPDAIHRAGGSPFGVALVLVLILFLLHNRISIFSGGGGDDDGDGDE